jgi:hypothetical protein
MLTKTAVDVRWVAGVAVVSLIAVLVLRSTAARPHPAPPFPGTVAVTFLGTTRVAITGKSSLVGLDSEPNVAFRLMVAPERAEAITLLGATVFSSDRSGHPAGGGRWDTHTEGTRALGIVRDGDVLNRGPKRLLRIDIRRPSVLYLYFADGTMTRFWDYFAVRLEAEGGYVYSAVLERGAWRVVDKTSGSDAPEARTAAGVSRK